MHPAVLFTGQHCARPQLSGWSVRVHRSLAGIVGWSRTIEKTSALDIEIAETVGLEPIGQNTKQEMARKVRGRPPPKHVARTGLKKCNVQIAQARDLDVECTCIRQRRAHLHMRHFGSGRAALRLPAAWLCAVRAIDAVDPAAVDLLRIELQLQLLAHNAGEEAAH